MPLSGPGKFDDLLGDDSVRKIVCKPKGCARHFKRDMENSLDLAPPACRSAARMPGK